MRRPCTDRIITLPGTVEHPDNYFGAFHRLRVANPTTLFDSQLTYNLLPLVWEGDTVGGGTIVHLPNESASLMTVGTTSGDMATSQTKQYFRYQPGKSMLIMVTGIMASATGAVTQSLGYFDDHNGLFFKRVGNILAVVSRSYTSGAVVDTVVNQTDWNIDKMDGTGPSGIVLNPNNAQIWVIDFEWLGTGRVRMGFFIAGQPVYVHQFLHANLITTVYMTTANLPIRFQIQNTAGSPSNTSLKMFCGTVVSEGGWESIRGISHEASNGVTPISVTTRQAVLSVQPKLLFNGITNRGTTFPREFDILNQGSAPIYYEIILNGTLGGTPSWTDLGSNSLLQQDVAGTTVTGGDKLEGGYVMGSNQQRIGLTSEQILNDVPLGLNIAGTVADTLSIVCTSLGAAAPVNASLTLKEFY